MEEKLDKLNLNDAQKVNLLFSLGKAYEDIEDYEKSFNFLKKANDTKKNLINRNFKKDYKTFNNLKKFFKDYNFSNETEHKKNKKIIFIIGLPRSGTSLIEQIISSHSKVHGCGELDFIHKIVRENFYTQDVLDNSILNSLDENKVKRLWLCF